MGSIEKRILSDGSIAYYARYVEADGKRTARSTKARNEDDAIKFLHALETRVRAGQVGLAAPTKEERVQRARARERAAMTVRQLCDQFLKEYRSPKVKDRDAYIANARSVLKHRIWPTLEDRPAAKVTSEELEQLSGTLLANDYKPRSVIMAFAVLGKVYEWARRSRIIDIANPVHAFDKPPKGPSSLEYLSKHDAGKLLAHAEEHAPRLHPMIAAALYTGMRKGELFGLRWQDVHLEAARVDVMRSYALAPKSGKERHLPMHPELVRILRGWEKRCPASRDKLVFPVLGNENDMGETWDMLGLAAVMKAAGVTAPTREWHALRHTFASHFMMRGGNILSLRDLLGHGSVEMTMIYAHLAPDFMAAEVARMSFPPPSEAEVDELAEARRQAALSTQSQTGASEADSEGVGAV